MTGEPPCCGAGFRFPVPSGSRVVRRWRGFPRSCCIRRRGLRGGAMVWRHADREGIFSALRRDEYLLLRGGARARRCVATEGGGCALRRAGYRRVCGGARVPTFLLHRQAGTARRNDGLTACRPGGRFQRFTPRGLLRWRGTRGALRVLFFLGVSPPAKKSTQKRSQALLFFRAGQRSSS